jgi:predicted phosphodiesterase
MSPLTIAVISDIHIGESARSADLLPPGSVTKRRNEGFLAAFEKFVGGRLNADCLIVAGDLSSKADPGEFMHASDIATRVANALNVPLDKFYATFGNHDVDWSVIKLAKDATEQTRQFRWGQRYLPITATTNIFGSRTASPIFVGSLTSSPFAGYWQSSEHLFVAVNTAAHDRPSDPIHYGLVREETIAWLSANIPQRAPNNKSVRCLILHHHLVPHGNVGADALDHSVCQNGDQLLTVLRDLDFDLVIHGHKHRPRFEIELIDSDHPVAMLGAGSFCADLSNEFGGGVHNQFHLLEIHGRYQNTSRLYGELRNWAYVFPSGWTENVSKFTVVDHLIGFGGPLNWKELAASLHQPIKNRAQVGKPFPLSSIGPIYDKLRYVSPDTARRAIEEIARIEKLEIAWVSGFPISAFLGGGT